MDGLSVQTVARDRICLFGSFSILLKDGGGECNELRQNAIHSIYVVAEGQRIQPPTTTVAQVEIERGVSVVRILNQHHYPFNFNGVHASISNN
jgi:hypothetical protein